MKWQVRDERGFGLALVTAHNEAEAIHIFLGWQLNGMVYWHGVPPTDPKTLHAVPGPSASGELPARCPDAVDRRAED
jgi:hypothetical protein